MAAALTVEAALATRQRKTRRLRRQRAAWLWARGAAGAPRESAARGYRLAARPRPPLAGVNRGGLTRVGPTPGAPADATAPPRADEVPLASLRATPVRARCTIDRPTRRERPRGESRRKATVVNVTIGTAGRLCDTVRRALSKLSP